MNERIIVSMTSYPGRIANVSKSIFLLLKKQTLPPDEIHLWLAEPEFLNKELSLPSDLQTIIKTVENVHLHWLPENTYCHKRHEIFKYTSDDDLVFLIDDDVRYSDDLIQKVVETHNKFPNCIICYNQYSKHEYDGRKIIYGKAAPEKEPKANWNRWCGQSMIPAKLYPKEILSDENQEIRNQLSPISDECWLQPWLVFYDIPIYHLHYNWGIDIDKNNGKRKGLCSSTHTVEANGYEKRDNWLYAVLSRYPFILDKYHSIFSYNS